MLQIQILAPTIVLVLWSFVMLFWLYVGRISALRKQKVVFDPEQPVEAFQALIPPRTRWKADNYNHLMEQPTLFYAVALTLALVGAGEGINVWLAWAYVGLRIVHSLVQATVNVIMLRFFIFVTSSIVLLAMTVRAAIIVF